MYGWTYEHLQILIGEREATEAMGRFFNHILGGRAQGDTFDDMNLVKVTPSSKDPKARSDPSR